MKKIIKSRLFITIFLLCLIGSVFLIVLNLSQVKKYQLNKRNKSREKDISLIIEGLKNYITNNNNLPTISNLDQNSFLPELIFVDKNPTGGISIQSLENMNGYFDPNLRDPSGNPYLIGTTDDRVLIYTPNFEVYKSNNIVYYKVLKITSLPSGTISADEIKE